VGSLIYLPSAVRRGFKFVLAASLVASGCSKSPAPGETKQVAATSPDGSSNGSGDAAKPDQPEFIYATQQTNPTPAETEANKAWLERCARTAIENKAADQLKKANDLQTKEDFAEARAVFKDFVATEIELYGEQSPQVKAAKNRGVENEWLATLSPDDIKQLRECAKIEGEAAKETAQGHFQEALNKGLQAAQIYRRLHGDNTAEYAKLVLFIADKYVLLGDFKTAAAAYQRALDVIEKTEGLMSGTYASALVTMSGMWMNLGDFVQAMHAVENAKSIVETLGADEASSIYCQMTLGVIHKEVGDMGGAQQIIQQALKRAEALGPNGTALSAECLQHLAGISYRQQNFSEAEALQLKAMELMQQAFGESPILIGCRCRLARIYMQTGKGAQAESILRGAIPEERQAFGASSPLVSYSLQYLGELYVSQHKFAEAAPLLTEAITIREKGHGPNHPAIAELLEPYATALRGLGRGAEADEFIARKQTIDANTVVVREKLTSTPIASRPTERR